MQTTRNGERRPQQWEEDVQHAHAALEAGHKLDARLWAALIGEAANEHTYQVCRNSDGKVSGFGSSPIWEQIPYLTDDKKPAFRLHQIGTKLNYFLPFYIADKKNAWMKIIGRERMLQLIGLLKDKGERDLAWNYAHGIPRVSENGEDVGPAPSREWHDLHKQLEADTTMPLPYESSGLTADERAQVEAELAGTAQRLDAKLREREVMV